MDRAISEGKWVEAFKPGTFTDFSGTERTFSPEDISKIASGVKNQIAAGYMPPVVKGHPQTDSPRKASIIDAKVGDKNILMLKLDKAEPKFAEEVRNGEFPYVSVALHRDYSKGLKHLGALGGIAPAVKGLQPLEFAEGEEMICFASPFGGSDIQYAFRTLGRMFRGLREKLIEEKSVEDADNIYPEWDIKTLEDFEMPSVELVEESGSGNFAEGDNKIEEENKSLKTELEKLKAKKAEAEAEAKKNAFASKLDDLQKANRLGAGQRERAERMFEFLSRGSLSFAEGEADGAEKALLAFMDSLPQAVAPGEFNFGEGNSELNAVETARQKISELVSKEGLSYAEALNRITTGRK